MNEIDANAEEANNTAAEFREIIKGIRKRETGLRESLETGPLHRK